MDWIPKPAHVANPLPPVPCLNDDDNGYDHHPDWNNYTAREGYTPRPWQAWSTLFNDSPPEFIAFLERWLFWGQLERIFDGRIFDDGPLQLRPGDYVSSKRNIRIRRLLKVLPTKILRRDHESWSLNVALETPLAIGAFLIPANEFSELPDSDFDPAKEEICMRTFCTRFAKRYRDPRPAPLRWASTLISELAVTDINRVYAINKGEECHRNEVITVAYTEQIHPRQAVLERLFSCGWCPWEVRMLHERFNAITCLYISQMQRPNSATTHPMLRPPLRNGFYMRRQALAWECSPSDCQLKKVDQNSYSTAHARSCRGCGFVAIDPAPMFEILHAGRIPLIPIRQITAKLSVIGLVPHCDESEKVLPYVAFSHVWSDGLGNLEGNSLPRCQLERLRLLIDTYNSQRDTVEPIGHFWLDTLCVPPDSANTIDLQQLATHKMKDTYEQAVVVIVLDQWLIEASSKHMKASEIVVRIVCSPWTRRLWTLQEGLLARWHGLFVVLDHYRLYNVDNVWERLKHVDVHWPWRLYPILTQTFGRYQEVRTRHLPDTPQKHHPAFSISVIARSMQHRSTSVESDEALCLSVILGVDTIAVAQASADERMKTLWAMLRHVPLTLLFWDYPRLAIDGLQWAPSTLLHPQSTFGRGYHMVDYRGCVGGVRPEGLLTKRPGFMFTYEPTSNMSRDIDGIWLRFKSGLLYSLTSYVINVSMTYDDMRTESDLLDVCKRSHKRRQQAHQLWGPYFAVIWLPEDHMRWLHSIDEIHGLLVAVEEMLENDALVVRLIEGVSIASEYRSDGMRRSLGKDKHSCEEKAVDVVEYGDEQLWLIK